jgi:myo-inositol-1-phosphate synthase
LDRGMKGAITAPSAYFMKSPPVQYTDDEARRLTEEFIAESKKAKAVEKTKQEEA